MANYVKPVVFLLGKEMYGVDINLVQSIEKDLNVVPAVSYTHLTLPTT